MYGKKYWGAQRSTFIIDGDGTVVHVIEKASPKTHDDEVLGVLAARLTQSGASDGREAAVRVTHSVFECQSCPRWRSSPAGWTRRCPARRSSRR